MPLSHPCLDAVKRLPYYSAKAKEPEGELSKTALARLQAQEVALVGRVLIYLRHWSGCARQAVLEAS